MMSFTVHIICLTLIQEMTSVTLLQMVHHNLPVLRPKKKSVCFFIYKGHMSIDYLKLRSVFVRSHPLIGIYRSALSQANLDMLQKNHSYVQPKYRL